MKSLILQLTYIICIFVIVISLAGIAVDSLTWIFTQEFNTSGFDYLIPSVIILFIVFVVDHFDY